MKKGYLAILSVLLMISTTCLWAQEISFNLKDTNGTVININESEKGLEIPTFKNKNIIIMFYIYSGTPCQNELKIFEELRRKRDDLEIITFELKGLTPQQLADYKKERNLDHLHMIDAGQALPFANYIARRARWEGSVPLIMILDKNSTLRHMQLGAMGRGELEKHCN